jgi:hypothetical protein
MVKERNQMNPAEKERRDEAKAFQKKTKRVQAAEREVRDMLNDVSKIDTEIAVMEEKSVAMRMDKGIKDRIVELQRMRAIAVKKQMIKDAAGKPTINHTPRNDISGSGSGSSVIGPPPPPIIMAAAVITMGQRPEDSVYYHPQFNPTGAPPAGRPPMYRTVQPPPSSHLYQRPYAGTGVGAGGGRGGFAPPPPPPPPPPTVTSMAPKIPREKSYCFDFQKNACQRGDKCPYEHAVQPGRSSNNNNNNNNNNYRQPPNGSRGGRFGGRGDRGVERGGRGQSKGGSRANDIDPLDASSAMYNADLDRRSTKEQQHNMRVEQEQARIAALQAEQKRLLYQQQEKETQQQKLINSSNNDQEADEGEDEEDEDDEDAEDDDSDGKGEGKWSQFATEGYEDQEEEEGEEEDAGEGGDDNWSQWATGPDQYEQVEGDDGDEVVVEDASDEESESELASKPTDVVQELVLVAPVIEAPAFDIAALMARRRQVVDGNGTAAGPAAGPMAPIPALVQEIIESKEEADVKSKSESEHEHQEDQEEDGVSDKVSESKTTMTITAQPAVSVGLMALGQYSDSDSEEASDGNGDNHDNAGVKILQNYPTPTETVLEVATVDANIMAIDNEKRDRDENPEKLIQEHDSATDVGDTDHNGDDDEIDNEKKRQKPTKAGLNKKTLGFRPSVLGSGSQKRKRTQEDNTSKKKSKVSDNKETGESVSASDLSDFFGEIANLQ